MQCVTPQIILLVIVDPSGWNEGLITSAVRVVHAKWWQITLFWVWLEVLGSLAVDTACARPCLSPLSVSPPPRVQHLARVLSLHVFVSLLSLFFFVLCARHHVLPWFELFSMCLWELFYFLNWFDAPPQATYDASSLCPDWIDLHVKINYSLTDRPRVLQHLAAMLPAPCSGMHYQCISHDSSVLLFFLTEDHDKLTQHNSPTRAHRRIVTCVYSRASLSQSHVCYNCMHVSQCCEIPAVTQC